MREYNFIDTNILIYSTLEDDLKKNEAANKILNEKPNLFISNQIIFEYINSVTDNALFEYPLTLDNALANIDRYLLFIQVVENHNIDYLELKKVVTKYNIDKTQLFDLNIYLIMKLNDISNLITFNTNNFEMFRDISVICPIED